MRTTTMRITNTTINRNFTRSINDVHELTDLKTTNPCL